MGKRTYALKELHEGIDTGSLQVMSDANKSVEWGFILGIAVVEQKTDTNREVLEHGADDLRGDLEVSDAGGVNQQDHCVEVLGDVGRRARVH